MFEFLKLSQKGSFYYLNITALSILLQLEQLQGEQKPTGKRAIQGVLICATGTISFILLPAVLFYHLETDWTFLDSAYFAFVSLSTIGFGDLANTPLSPETEERVGSVMWFYKTYLVLWIMLGLVFSSLWFGRIANILEKLFKVQEAKDDEREP